MHIFLATPARTAYWGHRPNFATAADRMQPIYPGSCLQVKRQPAKLSLDLCIFSDPPLSRETRCPKGGRVRLKIGTQRVAHKFHQWGRIGSKVSHPFILLFKVLQPKTFLSGSLDSSPQPHRLWLCCFILCLKAGRNLAARFHEKALRFNHFFDGFY